MKVIPLVTLLIGIVATVWVHALPTALPSPSPTAGKCGGRAPNDNLCCWQFPIYTIVKSPVDPVDPNVDLVYPYNEVFSACLCDSTHQPPPPSAVVTDPDPAAYFWDVGTVQLGPTLFEDQLLWPCDPKVDASVTPSPSAQPQDPSPTPSPP